MNNKHPISLSAYYLDFSYPGFLTLETRMFLSMPLPDNLLEKNQTLKFVEICFDMTSVFNKEQEYKSEEMDRGLIMRVGFKEMNLPEKNIQSYFTKQMKSDTPQVQQSYFFESEQDLYENIIPALKEFLPSAYNENWVNFIKESREKYLKKHYAYVSEKEKDEKVFLENQLIKINKFSEEAIKRTEILLNTENLDEKILKKINLSLTSNGTGLTNQILGGLPANEREEVFEFKKILNAFQYHNLSKKLHIKEVSRNKPKKV